jgi:hypothetical protein
VRVPPPGELPWRMLVLLARHIASCVEQEVRHLASWWWHAKFFPPSQPVMGMCAAQVERRGHQPRSILVWYRHIIDMQR